MQIGVPDPSMLDAFYQEIGFTGGPGTWGSADFPAQITLTEAPYRQLKGFRVACSDEADLAAAATRLDGLGVAYELANGRLTVTDPINEWDYVVEPAPEGDVAPQPHRVMNYPGERNRLGQRAEVIVEAKPRPPRRLGHLVAGSPEPQKTVALCQALGFRVSDTVFGGMATFMRCSSDHHNLLITPGPVPHLNHYAVEHDDFDAVMRAATEYLGTHGPEQQIAGPGRHQIGGNIFWYMRDPSGTFFEYFADMDQIVDDDAWEIKDDWDPADSWSVWGEKQQPEVFFAPHDMQTIIEGWNSAHG
jgi:hypothetical protein